MPPCLAGNRKSKKIISRELSGCARGGWKGTDASRMSIKPLSAKVARVESGGAPCLAGGLPAARHDGGRLPGSLCPAPYSSSRAADNGRGVRRAGCAQTETGDAFMTHNLIIFVCGMVCAVIIIIIVIAIILASLPDETPPKKK